MRIAKGLESLTDYLGLQNLDILNKSLEILIGTDSCIVGKIDKQLFKWFCVSKERINIGLQRIRP